MSDNTRLGISITATDTATASLAQLRATIRGLEQTLRDLGGTAADQGGKISNALNAEIAAINREIAARGGQATAIRQVTAALQEQATAAAVVHRTLQQGIDASMGVNADRAIKSAAESARVLATSLSAAAEADSRLRDAAGETTAALEGQVRASRAASRAAVGGAETSAAGALLQRESRHIVGVFDSLARGQRGQAFSSIGAAARDAGFGVAALSASIGGLVAIMGSAALLRGAENMGRWAAETRAAASAAGMSIESYSSLQGALTLTGFKANEADTALHRLAVNLSTAMADPASLAAQAFHNLGISQERLTGTGGNVAEALNLLARAFVTTADGANKSANMNEIFGRGFERIIHVLQNGGGTLENLQARAKALGLTLTDETAKGLEETGDKARGLFATIEGDGIKAFEKWQPVIRATIDLLKELVAEVGLVVGSLGNLASGILTLSKEAISSPFESYPEHVKRLMLLAHPPTGASATKPDEPKAEVPPLTHGGTPTVLETMRAQMHEAALVAAQSASTVQAAREAEAKAEVRVMQDTLGTAKLTAAQRVQIQSELQAKMVTLRNEELSEAARGQSTVLEIMRQQMAQEGEMASRNAKTAQAAREAEGKAEIAVMEKTLKTAQLTAAQRAQIEAELANKQMSLRNSMLSAQNAAENRAAKQNYADFASAERLKISEAQGSTAKIIAIYDEWIAAAETKYKQHVNVIKDLERQKVQAINAARLTEIKEGAKQEEQQSRLARLNAELQQMASGKYHFGGQKETVESDMARSAQYIAEAQQVRSMADKEIAALKEVESAAETGSSVQKAAAQEILNVQLAAKQKEVELYKQAGEAATAAANKVSSAFNKFFEGIGSEIEQFTSSVVKSLIAPQTEIIKAGLTSIKTSMRGSEIQTAFTSLLTGMANSLQKSVIEAVGSTIARALSGGAADTIGQLLTQTFSKILSSVAGGALGGALGTAAGGAAGSAAVVSAVAAAAAAETSGISAAVAANAAATVSAVTASSASVVGAITAASATQAAILTATLAKPSVLGTTFALGGIVPSAAGGMMTDGMGGTLAILHAREMVLPAPISHGLQQMISQGTGGSRNNANLNYAPTINNSSRGRGGTGMTRAEFGQMLSMHSGSLLGEARNMMRQGWRPE